MSNLIPVKVPDIGDVSDVDIIEVLVAEGDEIAKEDPLITLETDKATMEVPSPQAGVVKKIHVKVGDKVSEGSLIVEMQTSDQAADKPQTQKEPATNESDNSTEKNDDSPEKDPQQKDQQGSQQQKPQQQKPQQEKSADNNNHQQKQLSVPDIGDAADVDIIEVLISKGDKLEKDQGVVVLETDKATMEVPASDAGEVVEVLVKVGDKVSQGDALATIKNAATDAEPANTDLNQDNGEQKSKAPQTSSAAPKPADEPPAERAAPVPEHPQMKKRSSDAVIYASPSVRRFARELGVDLTQVSGTANKGRIQKEDVQRYVKQELSMPKAAAGTASSKITVPEIDHAKWGEIETQTLSRIQKVSSLNLQRNWSMIPHVTQHEDADITELEAFRKSLKEEAAKADIRLTPLAFIMKAVVHSLKTFAKFNASLASDGESLIIKRYYHIGVAVETPDGLTVPVIRNVDKKGIYQLAEELVAISAKAREKKLSADDMQGSSFTISSLGGIGGTAFTPIVKWPDVAILGLSRNKMQPVWKGSEFVPRLMLPLSLSYDHRVIDGADAARFVVHLAQTLKDIRRTLLK